MEGRWYSLCRRIFLPGALSVWACIAGPVHCNATPPQAISAQPPRSAPVTAITSEVSVDGSLEEPAWQTAPKIGELIQREPRTGEQPSEKTEVTLLHDANNLYIGVVCYDSEPRRVIGTQMARDANLASDDRIQIVLDTYRDQRNAFYFATNPAGALVDGLVFSNGQTNNEWDTIWTVRTRRTSEGWTAEFAIPFKSLSFPANRTVWGFNFARNIQRKIEENRWSGARLETPFFQVSEAGEITGIDGVTQGRGLEIRPFVGGRWRHTAEPNFCETDKRNCFNGKPGLDMFYNFTPSLKLTATVNTDFGETEVDARQINLSRFSQFFPEKRSFFLEDAGVFSFSNTSMESMGVSPSRSQVIPFFSRQIGLLSGEEVSIDFGLKLTGKVGRTDIGILDVRTRALYDDSAILRIESKNFLVGRFKRNFFRQSYFGGIFARGNQSQSISSTTVGGDMRLATSRFLGQSRNFVVNAYALRSINEGNRDRDMSYGFSAEYPNDVWHAEFVWRDMQENFSPALGFVSRRNVRLLRVGGRYIPRPEHFLHIRQMFHDLFFTRYTRLDNGQVESWELYNATIDWHFTSGDAIHPFNVRVLYEHLLDPFQIYPGVVIPPGEYRFTRWRMQTMTASKRRLAGTFEWWFGKYWSGHANEFNTTLTYKIPPHIIINFTTNQTFARLPQGNFVTRVIGGQANYAASPFLTFSNLIQYDNRSRNLGWQGRVRWTLQPGNDLFLVFSQGWIQDPAGGYRFSAQDSKVSSKFQYTFRF